MSAIFYCSSIGTRGSLSLSPYLVAVITPSRLVFSRSMAANALSSASPMFSVFFFISSQLASVGTLKYASSSASSGFLLEVRCDTYFNY